MEAVMFLLLVTGVGAACVVGLAQLLWQLPRLRRLRTGTLLAASHTLIVCGFLAVAPLYIAAERAADSPYGDVYVPYLLVPGVHVDQPARLVFGQAVFPWLLGHMEYSRRRSSVWSSARGWWGCSSVRCSGTFWVPPGSGWPAKGGANHPLQMTGAAFG